MKITDGKLVLENRACWNCNGTQRTNEWVTCPQCNGTGKQRNRRNCLTCKNQRVLGSSLSVVLSVGTGNCNSCIDGIVPEQIGDYAPATLWQNLRFTVYRSDRQQQLIEKLFGFGCWSTTDYGDHKHLTDESLIAHVRFASGGIQACKFVKPDTMQICNHIGIFCNNQGYSVVAVF